MIIHERSVLILRLLRERGILTIARLAELIGDVSEVTIRRDANRLAKLGLLKRTRGGVVQVEDVEERDYAATQRDVTIAEEETGFEAFDAIILSPVEGRGALALRNQIKRMPVPFIAESAPQEGGVYLGPNNWAVGYALGCVAAREHAGAAAARLLVVSHEALPNTVARAQGFVAGLKDVLSREPAVYRVDGSGEYRFAVAVAKDAFDAHPDIDMVFGVNDHSVLAALDAAAAKGMANLAAYSVGGEGDAIFSALASGGALRACAALFPDIVGRKAIDLITLALSGQNLPAEVFTPFAILSAANLADYYHSSDGRFELKASVLSKLETGPTVPPGSTAVRRASVNFMPHYPAHDWYRNMTRAMQQRADALGLDLVVSAPQAGIAREIKRLRQTIASTAAQRVHAGDTILIGPGEVCLQLARELRGMTDLTVVTNSFGVLKAMSNLPGIKVIMTGGEYQEKDNCLVGPSLAALFEMMRVDMAFLTVDGISAHFGLSASDERIARATQRCISAARAVTVLGDHTLIGFEANHRVVEIASATELITDSGTLPAQRMAFASAGVRVTVAEEPTQPVQFDQPNPAMTANTPEARHPDGAGARLLETNSKGGMK